MTKVVDEYGQTWWVAGDDPAGWAVKLLVAAHYTWLVLPRSLIQTGSVPDVHATLTLVRRMRYNSKGSPNHKRLLECVRLLWEARDGAK